MDAALDAWIIIPTYNEAENIGRLIADILALPVEVGAIVVDDNSPDGTGTLAGQMLPRTQGGSMSFTDPPNSAWARRTWPGTDALLTLALSA